MIDAEERTEILTLLGKFISQRPGLEYANYGDSASYMCDYRGILKDLHDARILLRWVELSSMPTDTLKEGFRAFMGRLSLEMRSRQYTKRTCPGKPCGDECDHKGAPRLCLDYCAGQYFPTEYRASACAVLAAALWDFYRDDFTKSAKNGESAGDAMRRCFKRHVGRSLQTRWFN